MKALRYRIKLVEPALLTGIEGNPNDGVSLDYLPGSVLRGAIMRKYRQQHGPLDAANGQIRWLFLENSTRFLNGYLVNTADDPALCRRGLPLPLSFQRKKGTKEPLYDFSVEKPSEGPWQSVSAPFGMLTEDHQGDPTIYPLQPKRQLKVHNQRLDRDAGRPTERAGEVYRYESLAADQTFEAVILCDRETDTALLKPLLQGEILLGGARSGGYGRAFFQAITEEMAWREIGGKLITGAVNDGFTVTLLSDALVRDSWGQFVASAEAIKVALEQRWRLAPNSLLCEGERSFWRGQINGGFNRRWGLPLPQALAIKMGSVFAFSLSAGCQCTTDQLNMLEAEGIGERRAEGFGRVAVNWHAEYKEWTLSKASVTQPGTVPLTGQSEQKLAKQMAIRMLRQRLDERLAVRVRKVTIQQAPSHSQLSRLRNVVRAALLQQPPDLTPVENFLQNIASRQSARSQFERARAEGRNLLGWLNDVLDQIGFTEWHRLLELQDLTLPRVGNIQANYKEDENLRKEYLLRLIEGVLISARNRA